MKQLIKCLIEIAIIFGFIIAFIMLCNAIAKAECCVGPQGKQNLVGMTGWIPNIIPGNVVVFYDTDGDGEPDEAQAFHIIDGSAVRDCGQEITAPEDMFLFTTCPAEHAFNYWTLRGGWSCESCMQGDFVPVWMDAGQGSGRD